jgi:hypothetical protein
VTFKPSTAAALSGTLSVKEYAAGSQSVSLSGTGITPTAAATPVFSPSSGTYTSTQTVTISDKTAGATIYYTTNGTTPTTSSAKYTGAITVSSTETIEAIAAASGYSCSSVATVTYTINPPVATPSFSPAAGSYTSTQTVTISDTTTGVTIYYTTNGTAPTTSSAKYTGPITVSSTETIEAIATASGYSCSPVATATFTISVSAPAATPSFVQSIASASHGSPSGITLSFPSNTLAGDVLLVAFDYEGTTVSSVTDTQGNVFTPVGNQLASPGGALGQVYYVANIKGGADTVMVNLSGASSYLEAYLTEYSGVNPTSPIDAEAGASGSAGTVSSGNATTTAAGDMIYGYCVADVVCTVGSGFTARSTLNSNLTEDMSAGSAGSYAATGSANSGWTMQMVALKPASALTPPVIFSSTTASGTVGTPFSYQIAATNTPTSSGATGLPAGLSLNSATGLISGTPTSAASTKVSLSAANSSGTGNATLTLTIAASTPASFVQQISSATHGSPSGITLSFPSNTLAGDVLLVAFDYEGTTVSSVTDTQGNAFTPVGNRLASPGGALGQVYYAKNIKGGADTVIMNLSAASNYLEAYLTEYSGVNPTSPIDAEAGASGSAGTVSSGNATTIVAGDMIYGYCVADGACTVGSGFTARSTLNSNLVEDMQASSAGSYAATGSANSGWTMQMVALAPASASGSDPDPSPNASVSPTTLTFASQTAGTASPSQTVTLSNTGNAALSITGISITGSDPSDFAETNSCGSSVAAGTSCNISVTFTPAATGTLSATLTFTDNATGSPQSVGLTGTGANSGGGTGGGSTPAVTLSSTSLSFGNQPVDTTSSAQTVTLTNTGSAALSITSLTITGTNASDFTEVADTCGSSVAAGGTCTVEVTFTPSAASSYTATLSITDNATGSPQPVALSGTGTHDVTLSWTASSSSGVVGYNVYRGTASGGESSTPLTSSPVTATTFTDSNVTAGQIYYYVVTAVTSSDSQSADSTETSVTVP